MNMVRMTACILAISFVGVSTATDKVVGAAPPSTMTAAQFERAKYRKTGGLVKVPEIQKGKLVIVNAVGAEISTALTDITTEFSKKLRIEIAVESGSFNILRPELKGDATMFIINSEELPMSLIAPEAKWAMVNASALKHDKQQFYTARIKKEVLRTLALLCGGAGSQFESSLVSCMIKPEDLDNQVVPVLPIDVLQRIPKYLAGYDITPYQLVSYRKACMEGWAPAPTDTVQKVIWDKVHEVPSKPMKITFDPATQKGKVTK